MLRRTVLVMTLLTTLQAMLLRAEAHDIWITTSDEKDGSHRAIVNHGHPGDRKVPDPDKLFALDIFTGTQSQTSLLPGIMRAVHHNGIPILITAPLPILAESDVILVAAQYDNGFWVQTTHGHRNTSKLQVPDDTESLSSMKYAKALLQIHPATSNLHTKIVGHRLELVPLDDPFTMKSGESLSVKVYFEGKPLSGVFVELGDGITPMEEENISRFKTDEQGVAAIPLAKVGPQLLVVDYLVPGAYPDLAVHDLHNATLSFVFPPP